MYRKKEGFSIVLTALAVLLTSAGAAYGGGYGWHKYKPPPDYRKARAVTIWVIVINNPGACYEDRCTEDEIFTADNLTKSTMCYLSGSVVAKDGKLTLAGALGEGDSNGCTFPPEPDTTPPHHPKNTMDAHFLLLVQEHGEPLKLGDGLEDQVTVNGGGCNPDCVETQESYHGTDTTDGVMDGVTVSDIRHYNWPVTIDGTGEAVEYASSMVIRDREGVRIIWQSTLKEYHGYD